MTTLSYYMATLKFQLELYKDPYNYVEFICSWEDIRDKLMEKYAQYLDPPRKMQQLAAEVVDEEETPEARAEKLYNYVRDN